MMIAHKLKDNPPYDPVLAEQVLSEYLRIHRGAVASLVGLGCDPADVEQELRIHLWRQWTRYRVGGVSLQQWLSWRMRHKIRSMIRSELRRNRIRLCALDFEITD